MNEHDPRVDPSDPLGTAQEPGGPLRADAEPTSDAAGVGPRDLGGAPAASGRSARLVLLLVLLAAVAFFAPRLDRALRPDPVVVQHAVSPPPVVAPTGALEEVFELNRDASVRIEAYCEGVERTTLGVGTGFFIDEEGTLLTAYHVVDPTGPTGSGCRVRHRAVTTGGETLPLELVGFDAYFDLAVLHADADRVLPFVPLAERAPRPGDSVVAIGNSRNDFLQARAGQVTRLGVRAARANFADGTIELTAALAPGDSGGPVINRAGEAVGVVSYISFNPAAMESDGFIPPYLLGLVRPDFASYAVPVGLQSELVAALRAGEQRDVPVVGLSWQAGFDASYDPRTSALDLGRRAGTIIQFVAPGGPAEAAGLRPFTRRNVYDADGRIVGVDVVADVVISVDGEATPTLDDLMRVVRSFGIGETVELTVQRGNATLRIDLELGAKRTVFGRVN